MKGLAGLGTPGWNAEGFALDVGARTPCSARSGAAGSPMRMTRRSKGVRRCPAALSAPHWQGPSPLPRDAKATFRRDAKAFRPAPACPGRRGSAPASQARSSRGFGLNCLRLNRRARAGETDAFPCPARPDVLARGLNCATPPQQPSGRVPTGGLRCDPPGLNRPARAGETYTLPCLARPGALAGGLKCATFPRQPVKCVPSRGLRCDLPRLNRPARAGETYTFPDPARPGALAGGLNCATLPRQPVKRVPTRGLRCNSLKRRTWAGEAETLPCPARSEGTSPYAVTGLASASDLFRQEQAAQ